MTKLFKNITKLIAVLTCLILGIVSCVEPFEANFDLDQRILVVEGSLVDQQGGTYVRLREAVPSSGRNSTFLSVQGANVWIIENGSREIAFEETDLGIYHPVDNFTGKVGNSYQLKFVLPGGKEYESSVQEMFAVPEIKRVFQTTVYDELEIDDQIVPANFVYLDTEDPIETTNYYFWTWKLFEKMDICRSCEGGRFYTEPLPLGNCQSETGLTRRNVTYDYYCNIPCYQVINSNSINTQSDQFTNGKTVSNVLIAEVPYYKVNGALIEVSQQSLTREAYEYASLLADQGQNTGGLADTPPAVLIGNITGRNLNEAVSGYFMVSSMRTQKFWIDRTAFAEEGLTPYGLLGGRLIRPEPASAGPSGRPPFAPCIPSATRLITPPEGFKE